MAEYGGVRRLKVNKRFESHPCGWCGNALALGDDGAVCEACDTPHHAAHWDEHNGCSRLGCVNAPLKQEALAPAEEEELFPPESMRCPHCKKLIAAGTQLCPICNMVTSPDGIYHGPKTLAPDAKKALTSAIISIFICAPILAPRAIKTAKEAKALIDGNPAYGGRGMATAAQVIGVLAILLWVIGLLTRFIK